MVDMKYSPEKELLVLVILGFSGLIFSWLQVPVQISLFNYLPLFLISYLIAIFLPGYTFLSFIKPDLSFNNRLDIGIPLSLVLLFVTTFLFIFLSIPQAFTYAVTVLMILSLIMAFSNYLAEKMGQEKVATPPRKPSPSEAILKDQETIKETPKTAEEEVQEKIEKTIITRPPTRKIKLIPPQEEVEIIIPNHALTEGEKTNQDNTGKTVKNSENPTLKLPWIERKKEQGQQKK
jgi:hypothetical protein